MLAACHSTAFRRPAPLIGLNVYIRKGEPGRRTCRKAARELLRSARVEPNPYESPDTEQPLQRSQIAKRAVGFGTILLLTPPAMAIAIFSACTLASAPNLQPLVYSPLIIFGGLLYWAAYARQQLDGDLPRKAECIRVLWLTPLLVGLSFAVSIVLIYLAYAANVRTNGKAFAWWEMLCIFWAPPTVVLLLMLQRAWRYR